MFSVVIPAYNASSTIRETLDAVLVQTFALFEVIVVDDGSTDDTRAIAESYAQKDNRIRVVSKPNGGTASAYNAGLEHARFNYITICSADDILLPVCLETYAIAIEAHPDFDIYCSDGDYLLADGLRKPWIGDYSAKNDREITLAEVAYACFFSVGATYRKKVALGCGGYRADVYGEDYDLWLRMMTHGSRAWFTARSLALHRLSPTAKSANIERVFASHDAVLDYAIAQSDITPAVRQTLVQQRDLALKARLTPDAQRVMEAQRDAAWSVLQRLPEGPVRDAAKRLIVWGTPIVRPLRRFFATRKK